MALEALDEDTSRLPLERLRQTLRPPDRTCDSADTHHQRARRLVDLPAATTPSVARPDELERLRDELLSGDGAASTALIGCVGVGKTALALALCRDPQVESWFTDGAFWIPSGVRGSALTGCLDAIESVLGAPTVDMPERPARLRQLAQERAFLLVADDVDSAEDVLPLVFATARSRLLITTRDAAVARSIGAHVVRLGSPPGKVLKRWIAAHAGQDLGVMRESVDQRDGTRCIRKDRVPFLEC